jgi:hypothetical protein
MADQDIDFVDQKERELFAVASLGEHIRTFLLSDPVGRYLHHRAKAQLLQSEIDAGAVEVDGWRGWLFARRKLRQIRQRRQVAQAFINWLSEAIVDGDNAGKELDQYRER